MAHRVHVITISSSYKKSKKFFFLFNVELLSLYSTAISILIGDNNFQSLAFNYINVLMYFCVMSKIIRPHSDGGAAVCSAGRPVLAVRAKRRLCPSYAMEIKLG